MPDEILIFWTECLFSFNIFNQFVGLDLEVGVFAKLVDNRCELIVFDDVDASESQPFPVFSDKQFLAFIRIVINEVDNLIPALEKLKAE